MTTLIIKPRARIFHGHDWVYSTEIQKVAGEAVAGDVVALKDHRNRPLGTAIYNPHSQIVARRFSRRKQDLDADFFFRRLERALSVREAMHFPEPVYRLAWSEADGLPGVIVDRYGDLLVVQTLTAAMDQRRHLISDALRQLLNPTGIVERNDSSIRVAEQLPPRVGMLHGDEVAPFDVAVAGIRQKVDLLTGQKTGLYLDQIDNYAAVARLAPGRRVLDCFCNQGGFALHSAKAGAASVKAVDISETAIAQARENAATNGLTIDLEQVNAFDYLKKGSSEREEYDLIILDPPSFTKNRKSLQDALRGYKEIHLRALKMLSKDGILATFCCSHHVSREDLLQVMREASVDAHRLVRQLAIHSQRRDHPVVPTLPETEYLKGFTFQAMAAW